MCMSIAPSYRVRCAVLQGDSLRSYNSNLRQPYGNTRVHIPPSNGSSGPISVVSVCKAHIRHGAAYRCPSQILPTDNSVPISKLTFIAHRHLTFSPSGCFLSSPVVRQSTRLENSKRIFVDVEFTCLGLMCRFSFDLLGLALRKVMPTLIIIRCPIAYHMFYHYLLDR